MCVGESERVQCIVCEEIHLSSLIFLLFRKGHRLQSVHHLAACFFVEGVIIDLGTQRGLASGGVGSR